MKPLGLLEKIRRFGADPFKDYYHGGTREIKDQFHGEFNKPDGDWGAATYATSSPLDASANYATRVGPDNQGRIENLMDELIASWEDDTFERDSIIDMLSKNQLDNIAADLGEDYFDARMAMDVADTDPEAILPLIARDIAEEEILGDLHGVNYPLKINTGNYATIGQGGTYLEPGEGEHIDALLERVMEALQDTNQAYDRDDWPSEIMGGIIDNAYSDEAVDLTDLDWTIRNTMMEPAMTDSGEMMSHGATSAQVLANLGYEGVIDRQVNKKFGTEALREGMEGVTPGTEHVITFPGQEQKNIRSKFAEFAEPGKEDMSKPGLLRSGAGPTIAAGLLGLGALGSSQESEARGPSFSQLLEMGYPENTARKIASGELPMDAESIAKRAKEQGYTQDNFHASMQDIKGPLQPGYSDGLTFSTPNVNFANDWVGKGKMQQRKGTSGEVDKIRKQQSELRKKHQDFAALEALEDADGNPTKEWHDEYNRQTKAYRAELDRDVPANKVYGSVYPVRVNEGKKFDPSTDDFETSGVLDFIEKKGGYKLPPDQVQSAREGNYMFYESPEMVEFLKDKGYNSMRLAEYDAPMDTTASFDPSDVRAKNAAYDPDNVGVNNMMGNADPRLLAATAAGTTGLAAIPLAIEEMDRQGEGTTAQAYAGLLESLARDFGGFAKGLWTGDAEQRKAIQDAQTIPPTGVGEFVGELAEPVTQGLLSLLQRGQEAAYDPVTEALEATLPGSEAPVGDQLSYMLDNIGRSWDQIPGSAQERLFSAAGLGVMAADALPGPNPVNIPKATLKQLKDTHIPGNPDAIDPRYFKRVTEARKGAENTYPVPKTGGETRGLLDLAETSIVDLEGRPFVASIADRTDAARIIHELNGRELRYPVNLQGGQKFMQELENMKNNVLWGSAEAQAQGILNAAREMKKLYGVDPIYLPWRMTPTGSDFATMSGDLMLSNALTVLPRNKLKQLTDEIRQLEGLRTFPKLDAKGNKILNKKGDPVTYQKMTKTGIEDFPDLVRDPDSAFTAWQNATGDQRKEIKDKILDKWRNETGLSHPDARIAVTDPDQLYAPDFMLQNYGIIDTSKDIGPRGHNTYDATIFGTPEGRIKEDVSIFDLFPGLLDEKGGDINKARRSLETKAATGIMSPAMLDALFR